jgi:hypothetical protein
MGRKTLRGECEQACRVTLGGHVHMRCFSATAMGLSTPLLSSDLPICAPIVTPALR